MTVVGRAEPAALFFAKVSSKGISNAKNLVEDYSIGSLSDWSIVVVLCGY